jgi:hypothetical protein
MSNYASVLQAYINLLIVYIFCFFQLKYLM